MNGINRRRFLQLAGAGSLAAATAGAATVMPVLPKAPRLTAASNGDSFSFRAVAGMPTRPLPSYASYVIEGHVDVTTKTGIVTKSVFAGHPEAMSTVALPGMSRIIRIVDVENMGDSFYIKGMIDDRSVLLRGESRNFEMRIDPSSGVVLTDFFGSEVQLLLDR